MRRTDDSLRSPRRKRGKTCFSVGNEKKKEERLDMRQGDEHCREFKITGMGLDEC